MLKKKPKNNGNNEKSKRVKKNKRQLKDIQTPKESFPNVRTKTSIKLSTSSAFRDISIIIIFFAKILIQARILRYDTI